MKWLILWNIIAILASIGLIWIGFCETNSFDLILGIIFFIANVLICYENYLINKQ